MNKFAVLVVAGVLAMVSLPTRSQQNPVTLADLRDRQRVLLVFANGDNSKAEAQLTDMAAHAAEFRERDLVLAGVAGRDASLPTVHLTQAEDEAARRRFHVKHGEFTVLLLGKDGGEKLRANSPIDWNRLQSTIDNMPMRHNEIRMRRK